MSLAIDVVQDQPAAIASAVNDALAPAGAAIDALPMTPQAIWRALQAARPTRS